MNQDFQTIITDVMARAPEWIRHDLVSKDHAARTRAEEAMAAMIAKALNDDALTSSQSPPVLDGSDPANRSNGI